MNEKVRKSRDRVVLRSPFGRTIMVLVIIVLAILLFESYKVFNEKNKEFARSEKRIEQLENEISDANKIAEEFKRKDNNSVSDEDIEKVARQELGLIKRDEIVIKPN